MSSVTQNAARMMPERFPGAIVAGFDVHLRQITFDCLDSLTGIEARGLPRGSAEPLALDGAGEVVRWAFSWFSNFL